MTDIEGSDHGLAPQPLEPGQSPLLPRSLVDLFLRPTRFFQSRLALGATPYVVAVTLACGIAAALGRAEKKMVQADLSGRQNALEVLGIADSWPRFWAFILIAGVIGGGLVWLVGGWWYRVRLRWSGAADPDARSARLVYIYASFVQALPAILIAMGATLLFQDYSQYWASDELWSSVGVVFPFWSCVTSYKGATTMFELSQWRARLWFLGLPILVYSLAVGVVGMMYALLTEV